MNNSDMILAESMAIIHLLGRARGGGKIRDKSVKIEKINHNCASTCKYIQRSSRTKGEKKKAYAEAYAKRDLKIKELDK